MKKHTIDDLIVQDIIFIGNYTQAKDIVAELKKRNINTSVIDEMICIVDPTFRMSIENSGLTLYLNDTDVEMSKDKYLVIKCDDIDIECQETDNNNEKQKEKQHKVFMLNEVVHAVMPDSSLTDILFNIANARDVTAIITAIDEENEMCEIAFLHTKHKTMWISFDNLFHIQHSYNEALINEYFDNEYFDEDDENG